MRNQISLHGTPGTRNSHRTYTLGTVLVALGVALSGCMSLAPHYERPSLPVSDAWPADALDRGTGAVTRTPWRDYFPDPQLQALIEQALAHNRDLRIAVQRVEQARAGYGIRRADQFPSISAGASYARLRTPGGFLANQPMISSLYNVDLVESNWELDFWGRVRSLKDAALEDFLASEASQRAATVSLIGQVADSYLVIRQYDERIALTRETIASRAESLRIFRRRFEVGAISRLDLEQSEILLQQAQTLDAQLEQARATEAHALELLVGAPPRLSPEPQALDDASVRNDLGAGLPSALLENRPDIVAAEHQLRAANSNIGAARAAFFPRISLTGSFGTSSTELRNLFASGTGTWLFLPDLSLPIFDAGRNLANLKLAQAQREEAVAQYERSIQAAFRDVADALSARDWLTSQVSISRKTLAAQTERARLARLRYDSGATPFLEVLDAQRDLLAAQQQLVQTRGELLSSRVALYAALGGGSLPLSGAPSASPANAEPSTPQDQTP
ncbi:efflux transporter outer membrane subunit [Paraburkholderia sp. HP33-1]|uniref:efflux transporter outer membrane subunit n=1 Tax=Paraburkholderia sp. HP33-1 TaxID=2883243 RepID=UPI003FA38C23